jgi:hypothetical protein
MSLEHTLIIRPSFTVLSGAAIGLVAGAAVYGAVSSAATPTKTAKAVVAAAPAAVAHCAHGQKLEDGVCVIHVVRTVLVPAPAVAQVPTSATVPGAAPGGNTTAATDDATKGPDDATTADDATKAVEGADSETEDPEAATDGSALDDSADQAASDVSSVAAH